MVIIVKDVLFSERNLRKICLYLVLKMEFSKILPIHPMTIPTLVMLFKSHSLSIKTLVKTPQSPPQINHHCCYSCGDPLEDIFCHQCTCELCGNGAHYGYNCPPKVLIQHAILKMGIHSLMTPHLILFMIFQTFLTHLRKFLSILVNSAGTMLVTIVHLKFRLSIRNRVTIKTLISQEQVANARYWKIPACYDDDDDNYTFAITHKEPDNSLSMGDEQLDTISATKSDEFIKSSVENLVPNPSESEGEYECDVPVCEVFTTFSNILFDADYDFYSVDDQSFFDKDIPKKICLNPLFDEEIISIKIDPHHFNAESDLIESLLTHDSSIISSSSKIDSLFDEFTGELTLLKSIPPGINETYYYLDEETRFIKRLLYDNSSPRLPKEFISKISDAAIESFSPSPIPVEDSDSLMEEIDLSFTPDDPVPSGIEEDDYDSERDILILDELLSNNSLSFPEIESINFDIPSFSRPPAKPPDGNTRISNVKVMGDIFEHKDLNFNISFADALILMPKFGPSIKILLTKKDKLCELARTPLNEHYSAVLLKKLPEKLGDPDKFFIPCDFLRMAECLALADLGASINLMPLSVWNNLSLFDLSPTYFDADPRVLLILGRSFLKTGRALIDLFKGELTFRVGKEVITFNLDQTSRYSANYNDMPSNQIDVIDMACEEYSQEVLGFSDVIASRNPTPYYDPIVSTTSLTLTLFENRDNLLLEAFLNDDPSIPPPNQGNYLPEVCKELKICEAKSNKSSIDEPPKVELKDLPPHIEYAFLEGDDKLPVIIAKDLSVEEKTALITVLKSHNRASLGNSSIAREKTTFTCPYGTFAYCCMPFGLCNALGTFQRCMMAIFHDMIEKTMEMFMDDFSVFRNSFQTYLSYLERILKRCEDTNLCLNWEKSHFMVKEGIVLGHKIYKNEIEVDKAKVDVIAKLPHPTTIKGIRSFLGHAGFYRRKLIEAPILIAPDWDMPFELMCDASDFAIGAILGQRQEKHFRPIQHASKIMTKAESNYTTTEKEMLAMVYAFEKFRSYLIKNNSIVYTNHFALKYLFAKKDSKARLLC
uniref:Reverse transcriptase domain-containing protein n=1 Tax=Tanacetum cinerariifolium TaxID=118510 RepID=A0A6L2P4Y5_TANCI|nr:reverse transcriptase domain-containing protein [Tanacetum cinerariifolium]